MKTPNKAVRVTVYILYAIMIVWVISFLIVAIYFFVTQPKETVEVKTSEKLSHIVEVKQERYELMEVCSSDPFKAWLDYRSITSQNSLQYKLQANATTNALTGIRMIENRYLVAMTSVYGKVGDKLDIKLESGIVLEIMLGDIKGSGHDDCSSNRDGSMIEFIVDKNMIGSVKQSGDFNQLLKGSITEIRRFK